MVYRKVCVLLVVVLVVSSGLTESPLSNNTTKVHKSRVIFNSDGSITFTHAKSKILELEKDVPSPVNDNDERVTLKVVKCPSLKDYIKKYGNQVQNPLAVLILDVLYALICRIPAFLNELATYLREDLADLISLLVNCLMNALSQGLTATIKCLLKVLSLKLVLDFLNQILGLNLTILNIDSLVTGIISI